MIESGVINFAYRHGSSFGSALGDAGDWIAHAVARAVIYRTVFGLHGGALVVVGVVALTAMLAFRVGRRRRRGSGRSSG